MAKMNKRERRNKKSNGKIALFIIFSVILVIFTLTSVSADETDGLAETTEAEDTNDLTISIDGLTSPDGTADTVKILLLLTVLGLAPSILVLMTGFTRILIVLSFVRNALGLQQTPPNQVLIGLALFLTFFLMSPIFTQMNDEALQPYINEEIGQDEAIERALEPLRNFMIEQTYPADLRTFLNISNAPVPNDYSEIKTEVIIPAFIISELKRAFIIGFFIYVPFLIIDLVVASTLMSLGMMMLPPAMVAMPFKLILFMIVDGWGLIVKALFASF